MPRDTNITAFRPPERFYGDGPPHWEQKGGTGRNETAAEAEINRVILVRSLRKQADKEPNNQRRDRLHDIADQIDACHHARRCLAPACPVCARAFQRWFVWTAPIAAKLSAKATSSKDLAAVSIIPTIRISHGASLAHIEEQVTRVVSQINKVLTEAGVRFLVGGYDISANEVSREPTDETVRARTRYQIHLWGIGVEADLRQAEAEMRRLLPSSRTARTRVTIKTMNGSPAAYAYALKTNFSRRISIPARTEIELEERDTDQDGAVQVGHVKKTRRNTRLKALKLAQRAEIALFLDVLGNDRRLVLIGASEATNDNGKTVLRPALPNGLSVR